MKRIIKFWKKFGKEFKFFIQVYFCVKWNRKVYLTACSDNPELFVHMMKKWKTDLGYSFNYYIQWASWKGYLDIVKFLLKSNQVKPNQNNDYALTIAISSNMIDVVKLLIKDERISINNNRRPINTSMIQHKYEITKLLLDVSYIRNSRDRRRDIRSRYDYIRFRDNYLQPESNVGGYNYEHFQYACNNEHLEIVKYLLTKPYLRLDSSVLVNAASNGRTQIVELLMKNKKFDPRFDNNKALRNAASFNHTETIMALLKDKRVNPGVDKYIVLKYAIRNKNVYLLKMLLEDKRIDPSAYNNTLLKSIDNKSNSIYYKKIIKLLLNDERVLKKISDRKNIKELLDRNILPNYKSKKIKKKYR